MDDTHNPGNVPEKERERRIADDAVDIIMEEHPDEAVIRVEVNAENVREELNFYKEMKNLFKEYGKNTESLDFIIKNLHDKIREFDNTDPVLPDEEKFAAAICKHPYFKNPCDYPIRLITILKYLKHKGFNMNYTDIDLYVDRIIQKIDGVKLSSRVRVRMLRIYDTKTTCGGCGRIRSRYSDTASGVRAA